MNQYILMKRDHLGLAFLLIGLLAILGGQAPPQSLPDRSANVVGAAQASVPAITLPNKEGTLKMAVFGDTGRGSREQYELGRVMANYRQAFHYDMVLMAGDNIYGADKAEDMKKKFEDAYKALLDQGVKFYATLGNHDAATQKFYKFFNMDGKEYYRIKKNDVSIYSLNSNYLDKTQLNWLTTELAGDGTKWKIAFFHHPPFSSGGRHGSEVEIRGVLHPLFVKNGEI
jgi:3',5'-cyclic AMP phosphodiesterase CpdA